MHNVNNLFLPEVADEDLRHRAVAIAEKWSLNVVSDIPESMALTYEEGMLCLKDFRQPKVNGVSVDFLSGASQYRQQHGGGRKEPIAKAVMGKGGAGGHVVDATPGLGRDAFVLASLGMRVTMIERSPVVAALLDDGLMRLSDAEPALGARFTLKHGNSASLMQYWKDDTVDAVYLDPMFPHRKKSALVKKEMLLFQQLLGTDDDADALLAPALALAAKRVVVKRPNSAPVLAEKKPDMAITSKKHRFDVYLIKSKGE